MKIREIYSVVILTLSPLLCMSPAKADFFDDARQTVKKDIPHFFQNDVPHFFQDDIPCAFGGSPTSHTKKSCNDRQNSARRSSEASGVQPVTVAESKKDTSQGPVQDK